ncbi:MAG: O-antigen translocase [Gammaproteobacteria bacterium]|nr:O-antigen translocase [Gammaproteobacteria bacterium]
MNSHRQIFKSSVIIGSASLVHVVVGIIKVKVLAVLLGPSGVGLMGLFLNIMNMASSLAGCGISHSGVRQLAASSDDEALLGDVRRALWIGNLVLGIIGLAVLWLLREPVSLWIFGDLTRTTEVGWLGIGVLLMLVASSQTGLLQGLRRIGDLARVRIVSAITAAAIGIALVWWLGADGVVWFVITVPAVSVLVAWHYARRLARPRSETDWSSVRQQGLAMLKLGIPFMLTGLLTLVTQLLVRSILLQELGLDATGYFQAAWAISMTYVSFVLSAMGADYYPKLSSLFDDKPEARRLVEAQTEMALLLAGPALIAMMTLSPLVVHLLYAASFSASAELLRWQIMGDIFRVASWPLSYILLAQGRGALMVGTELVWGAIYVAVVYFGVQELGLIAAGLGFLFSYLVYLVLMLVCAHQLIGYRPGRRNALFALVLVIAGGLVLYVTTLDSVLVYSFGLLTSALLAIYSLRRLDALIDLSGWLGKRLSSSRT